ncbi:hypothetical protein [Blastopirellula marina]|uniref:Uncharacterized protein n=1 Tax=Blastopirellula marina TaxID=124 RepID=A0A2S8FW99_9BACT|nr:hypothetical protein [Blastopirellula marina]PQO36462.1 hypothetical protein C5Y98_12225 [Blastopirellula marina]PQO47345.1 hypothetical protein C5Y93_04705 [Blastopirellula marina]PTL44299.1 hypothetical protein C5Y97_12235 [Blastopirellula marina]
MLISALFASLLLCVAILMHATNLAAWRRALADNEQPDYQRKFQRQQFQRRTAVCYILAGIAAAIMIGHFIPHSIYYLIFWGCVLLLVLWMVLLAIVDIMATRNLILIERDRHIARRRALEQQYGQRREKENSPSDDAAADEPKE